MRPILSWANMQTCEEAINDFLASQTEHENLWAAQMCTPRYHKVLTHDTSPPLDVVMHLHLALYRGPICKNADFWHLWTCQATLAPHIQTLTAAGADTDGAKSSISSAYSNMLTQV